MANVISIGTALPEYRHQQSDILQFMQQAYELDSTDHRKLSYLYQKSGIQNRYSVLEDFSNGAGLTTTDVLIGSQCLSMDKRMELYRTFALPLSMSAIHNCIDSHIEPSEITHLITVSCTGMSAPGLDLEITSELHLAANTFRTSVNFMGCYAAVHALKLAQLICNSTPGSNVLIVATELCTLHFQNEYTPDNAASSLLFGDGSAAVLVSNKINAEPSLGLSSFYSHVSSKGQDDMSWKLSSTGFIMTLSSYVPAIIQEDISGLISRALQHANLQQHDITHWCLHPGGRKILDVISQQTGLSGSDMSYSSNVLSDYGNMSSPTILFVLRDIIASITKPAKVFGIAFGPGLTMETFIATTS